MDIHLENLTMEFGDVVAVNNLSTTIKQGELVSILGPSGCGKSTTLMILAGLYTPTKGRVWFGEKDVTDLEAEKREIGMVFQNYALYPHLTVLRNIMFPLRMQKVPRREARKRAKEMAALVQIDNLLDRKPGELSGGQQQRVAIARALVKEPKLLLLDEPLSNLDAKLRLEMREEIRRIQQEIGITAVFVTHDQEEALSISDRVMLLHEGTLQQEDKPQKMYKQPINKFAATFLGSPPINILTLTKQEESYVLENTETKVNVKNFEEPNLEIGLRPEDIFITDEENSLFSGEINHIETIGRDVLIRVILPNDESIRALVDPDFDLEIGEKCHIGIRPENIHYFSFETGTRLH